MREPMCVLNTKSKSERNIQEEEEDNILIPQHAKSLSAEQQQPSNIHSHDLRMKKKKNQITKKDLKDCVRASSLKKTHEKSMSLYAFSKNNKTVFLLSYMCGN